MTHEDFTGIVIEPGSRTTRLGISGDVTPACVVPSAVLKNGDAFEYEIPCIGTPPANGEVITPVVDGIVQEFDAAKGLWTHLLEKKLGMQFDEQPLTITEEAWTPAASKQKLLETVFEDMRVPLFQLVKGPLAATFEAARSTALVVSVGAGVTSAVPVIDGVVRSKATTHTRFAGDFIDVHVLSQLEHARDSIVPFYQIKSRQLNLAENELVADSNEFKLNPRGSDSYHSYQISRLINDFKRVCCSASPVPLRGPEFKGTKAYEFPSGFNLLVGHERTFAVEPLFQPTMSPLPDGTTPPLNSLGLSEVVYQTLQKVDAPPEVFDNLISNIVLHGGTTNIPGVAQRLQSDLQNMMPNMMPNIHMPDNHPVWVGASILASLNEFDESTWITKQQYEELGAQHLLEKQE